MRKFARTFCHFLLLLALLTLSLACDDGDASSQNEDADQSSEVLDQVSDSQLDDTDVDNTDLIEQSDTQDVADQDEEDQTTPEDQVQDQIVDLGPISCTYSGFDSALTTAGTEEGFLQIEAISTVDNPYNYLGLELLWDEKALTTVEFAGENYADCETCLTADYGCTASKVCDQRFLATSGSLEIIEWGEVGETVKVALTQVEMREVTYPDPERPFFTELVPEGAGWCLDAIELEATLDEL